jgi:hypothetical protein
VEKYNIFLLLNHIKKRIDRMALERIFAIVCFHDNGLLKETASIYGHYYNTPGGGKYTFDTYLEAVDNNTIESNPIKLYFQR